MPERTFLRIGAGAAMIGAILAIVVNALFPRIADPSDTEAVLTTVAESTLWTGNSVGLSLSGLLLVGGLAGLYRSITAGAGAAWARMGFAAALAGGTLFFAWAAVTGFAVDRAAQAWVEAPAAEKAVALHVAGAVGDIWFALFTAWTILLFGVAFLLYGLAISLSDGYPKWLGWVAVVGGVGGFLVSVVQLYQGPSVLWTNYLLAVISVLATVWIFVMGVLMWRKAGAAA